jgi:hypothetical protein
VVKGETLSALEKAKEAARQKALEEFRAGERDRTPAPVPAPKKEEKSWWGSLLDAGKGLLSAGTSTLAGLLPAEKVTGGGSKPLYAPAKQDDDPQWWKFWSADWNLQNIVEGALKKMLPTPPTPSIRTLELPDKFSPLPVGTALPVSNLLLPPNGAIGLIQPGKLSVLPANPPTTTLGT